MRSISETCFSFGFLALTERVFFITHINLFDARVEPTTCHGSALRFVDAIRPPDTSQNVQAASRRVDAPRDAFAVRMGVYCRTIESLDRLKPAASLHLGNRFLDCGAVPCVKVRRHTGRSPFGHSAGAHFNGELDLAHIGAKIVDIVLHRDLSRPDFAEQYEREAFRFIGHLQTLPFSLFKRKSGPPARPAHSLATTTRSKLEIVAATNASTLALWTSSYLI